MIRYAVVGAGGYAGHHIRLIRQHGAELGCKLSAVTVRPQDRLPGQIEQFAAEGVEVFTNAGEMFAALSGKVEGVFLPTAIYTHADLACAALAAGHNVYLEKPPAATVQEVDRMIAAERASGRMVCLGFQAISSESINLIKSRVVDGSLGAVRRLRCWAHWPRPDAYYARNEWAGRLKAGPAWVLDGPTNNALAHQTANMLYLASPTPRAFAAPLAVRAELYHAREIDSEDTSAVEVRLQSGDTIQASPSSQLRLGEQLAKTPAVGDSVSCPPIAYFIASHCAAGPHAGPWIAIDGEKGSVEWENSGRTMIRYADGRSESLERDSVDPSVASLANFTEAVRAGDRSLLNCTLEMGRHFTAALNGAFESAGVTRAIPARLVRREGEGPEARTIVDGLTELVTRCGKEGMLFSDAGAEWAQRTEPFDTVGYRRFPQRFRAP